MNYITQCTFNVCTEYKNANFPNLTINYLKMSIVNYKMKRMCLPLVMLHDQFKPYEHHYVEMGKHIHIIIVLVLHWYLKYYPVDYYYQQ